MKVAILVSILFGFYTMQPSLTPKQKAVLDTMEMTWMNDGLNNRIPVLKITGVNVQIVNGTGATTTVNATGNLIIGYSEISNNPYERTGSHNLIMGTMNNYFHDAYGCIISGDYNTITAPNSVILGSQFSQIDGPFSTISGADSAVILDPGVFCNILGGEANAALAPHSTITGGLGNFINVNGPWGTVSGGFIRTVFTSRDWAAGSLYENE